MALRIVAALGALTSYYFLFWLAEGALATVFPHASENGLVLVTEGAAVGAALPVAYFVFQHVDRRKSLDGAAAEKTAGLR